MELDASLGFPQPVKLGGMVRWKWSEVQAFLAQLKHVGHGSHANANGPVMLPAEPLAR